MSTFSRIGYLVLLFTGVFLALPGCNAALIEAVDYILGISMDKEFRVIGFHMLGYALVVISTLSLSDFHPFVKRNKFSIGLGLIVFGFYTLLFKDAVNVPINDDFDTLLGFANSYYGSGSFVEKLHLITGFYWESRLVTTRCLLVMEHALIGHIDIKVLILCANTCLAVIAWILVKQIRVRDGSSALALIVALLIFNPGYYDAVFWANDAIHYQYTLLFVLLTFVLAENEKTWRTTLAMISAVLAGITFGNGFLVFPIVIFFLLQRKQYRLAIVWMTIAILFSVLYFHNSPHKGLLKLHALTDYLYYSVLFLGNIFQFHYQTILPMVIGATVWLGFFVLMYKRVQMNNMAIPGLLLFCILSSLVAAQFRLDFGAREALSNRYGIFSVMALSALIVGIFNVFPHLNIIRFVLPIALAFYCSTFFFYYPEVPIRKRKLELFISDHVQHKRFRSIAPILPQRADSILFVSEAVGIFIPDATQVSGLHRDSSSRNN